MNTGFYFWPCHTQGYPPRGDSRVMLSGSWQRIFYGLKFMIRDFFSGKKILACILFGSYDFARDLWGFQKIRKDFWY